MISPAAFVLRFPAFADEAVYPLPTISFWIDVAEKFLNVNRWGASACECWPSLKQKQPKWEPYDLGTALYVAHTLTLSAQENEEAASGAPPGLAKGVLTAESVDKASASYDAALSAEENGGWWNLTVYGAQFLRLLRQFGSGGMYIGIGCDPNPQPWLNGPAWPGPYPFPSPTGFSS